ncbi:MAG: hypothetical protein GEV07_00095 [Streptosporangiales bacterium]|nr:hypothetical protein [Streptosporangiales bacterium]
MSDLSADRVRGFPPFPRQARGARFARSWWGEAWIQAMEETSLDRGRLSRGRTYARTGHVDSITVSPGRIAAPVHGSDPEPYDTVVTVEQLSDAQWDRFLDQVAGTAAHIAALLDHDMPPELVADASDAGVPLLPDVGDLEPECTCLDWGYPCKHAAALCYQVSWLLDTNPFLLLLLRGRGERELLRELQRRNAERGGADGEPTAQPPSTELAVDAYAAGPAPLPGPPPPPDEPTPLVLPPSEHVDVAALGFLAADAARRAADLLHHRQPQPTDVWPDTVRIAATCTDRRVLTRLAATTARPDELVRAATAWRYGGAAGLAALEEVWTPPAADLARAWDAVTAAWDTDQLPEVHNWRNRWTVGDAQLRYGQDRRWYPFREDDGQWWPAGHPDHDPVAVLTDLLA